MQKKAYPIGEPDLPKRKTKWRLSYTEMEASLRKVEKSVFIQKRHSVPSSSALFIEGNCHVSRENQLTSGSLDG